MHVNSLGLKAAEAAYSGKCDAWLEELRKYLTANRGWLLQNLQQRLPACKYTKPEATYLMWLDCRAYLNNGRMQGSAYQHFLQHAKVALNEGREFGACGEGFVRLNFGCPRSTLAEALRRMEGSLA
jgi:cystathionine beta-lyase